MKRTTMKTGRRLLLSSLLGTFLALFPSPSHFPVYGENAPQGTQTVRDIIAAEQDKSGLAGSLVKKEAELAAREEALKKEEERLARVKTDLSEEMDKLAGQRKEIEKMLADNRAVLGLADEAQEKNLKQLTRIFEGMPPDQAATVMEKMDVNLVLSVFTRMKAKQAAKVMAVVNPELSAMISSRMGRLRDMKER